MSRMLPILDQKTQERVLEGYRGSLVGYRNKPRLGEVLDKVLANPGSMTRAQLAFAVTTNGSRSPTEATALAVAVEYFHTASLLLDDLPCMDDALERRGAACPHLRFGEDAAILAALALINKSYALLWPLLAGLPPEQSMEVAALVDHALGVNGLIGGQARDLAFAQSGHQVRDVTEIADGKTGGLFVMCLVVPAMVASCSARQVALLRELARCWGRAYQLADDFKDLYGNAEQTGKTASRDTALTRPNLVLAMGAAAATAELERLLGQARRLTERLDNTPGDWTFLNIMNHRLPAPTQNLHAAPAA